MHSFDELVQRCTKFNIEALGKAEQAAVEALQTSSATRLISSLKMVQLQRAISAVGMFSMFEAFLQDELQCAHGFQTAEEILDQQGEAHVRERFSDLRLAINVLKHGRGRSYDALLQKASVLPFKVKPLDDCFFNEGDVSEVETLVEVDDVFLRSCADVIREVSVVLRRVQSECGK